jgi:hypothetical protein
MIVIDENSDWASEVIQLVILDHSSFLQTYQTDYYSAVAAGIIVKTVNARAGVTAVDVKAAPFSVEAMNTRVFQPSSEDPGNLRASVPF